MTVDDGTKLDSRQPIQGDEDSEVTRKSLSSSLIWWTLVSSLVERLLQASPKSDPFAMVIGARSVVEVRPDDRLRRTRLTSLLKGGTGAVKLVHADMGDSLPDGYQRVHVITNWKGQVTREIGFGLDTSHVRWRFLEGNPYYLKDAGLAIGASVVVDTAFGFIGAPGNEFFQGLEQQRLYDPNLIVVIPHTAAQERVLRQYVDWIQTGRPARAPEYRQPPPWDPTAPPDPVHSSCPVPIEAQFGVTGLIRDGVWSDGSELEAARRLLLSRFDLKIGIWDLANNATLRDALLLVKPPLKAARQQAEIPPQALKRAQKQIAKRSVAAKQHAELRTQALKALRPLQAEGWEFLEQYRYYRLPLTGPVQRFPTTEPEALGWLALELGKSETKVLLRTVVYNVVNIKEYVRKREAAWAAIAAPYSWSFAGIWVTLLQLPRGYGDDIDWTVSIREITKRVPLWKEQLSALFEQAMPYYEEQRRTSNSPTATITVTFGSDGPGRHDRTQNQPH